MSKQNKYTKAARGQECMVRVPGCPNNVETVVAAHYRMNGTSGMGYKPCDIQAAWCCSWCHDQIDGRAKSEHTREELRLWHAEGVFRTQQALQTQGVLKL